MELILIYGALLSVLVVCLLPYYLLSTTRNHYSGKVPPGRTGWPLIGETLEFYWRLQKMESEKFFFKRMAKYSSGVFKTSLFGDHYAVLCDVQGSKFLFTDSKKLLARKIPRIFDRLFLTPEYEAVFDTCTKPALLAFIKGDGLNHSVRVMDMMAQRHVQSWQSQEIMMYPSVKRYLFGLAIRLFTSIEDDEIVEKMFHLQEIIAEGVISFNINLPGTRMNRAIKAAAALELQIGTIVKQQRLVMNSNSSSHSDQTNLLSYLIQVHEDDSIVTKSIIGTIFAGYETSSSVICMTFKVLTDYPQVYHRVYEENMEVAAMKKPGEVLRKDEILKMRYTWNVVCEVMRLYPITPFITRKVVSDFTFNDFHISKGYELMISTYASHKDPIYFQDPEKFDPSRFDGNGPLPYTYMPFGGGSFVCAGKTYAQLAILVFIHNVVKKFTWKTMIPNEKIVGIPHPRPAKGLPLHLYPIAN